jgi:hypothetical protein
VIPPNKHDWSVAPHFNYLLDLNWRENIEQHEYYMLFVQEKSEEAHQQEMLQWQ